MTVTEIPIQRDICKSQNVQSCSVRRKTNLYIVMATHVLTFMYLYINEKSLNIIRNIFQAAVQFPGNISNAHTLLTLHPSSWVDLCNHLILPEKTGITENHFKEFLYEGDGKRRWNIQMNGKVTAYYILQCDIKCVCYITVLNIAKFI